MRTLTAGEAFIQGGIDVAVELLQVHTMGSNALTGTIRKERSVMATYNFKNQA